MNDVQVEILLKEEKGEDPRSKEKQAADRQLLKLGEHLLSLLEGPGERTLFGSVIKSGKILHCPACCLVRSSLPFQ